MSSHQPATVSSQVEGRGVEDGFDGQIAIEEVITVESEGNFLDLNAERIQRCPYFDHFIPTTGERSTTWDLMKKLDADGVVDDSVIGEHKDAIFFFSTSTRRYNFCLCR